jgi:hypothetical protein
MLVIEEASSTRAIHREPIAADAVLTLAYIHSSELVPVRGVLRVAGTGGLHVVETAFGGLGPGLPAHGPGDEWTRSGGLIVHRPPPVPMSGLRLRVKAVNDYRLRTPAGVELVLSALVEDGAAVTIRVDRDDGGRLSADRRAPRPGLR